MLHCQIVAKFALMSTVEPSDPSSLRKDAAGVAPGGPPEEEAVSDDATHAHCGTSPEPRPREIGGREGPEPTRFGDWEKAGRCIDF